MWLYLNQDLGNDTHVKYLAQSNRRPNCNLGHQQTKTVASWLLATIASWLLAGWTAERLKEDVKEVAQKVVQDIVLLDGVV